MPNGCTMYHGNNCYNKIIPLMCSFSAVGTEMVKTTRRCSLTVTHYDPDRMSLSHNDLRKCSNTRRLKIKQNMQKDTKCRLLAYTRIYKRVQM